jgi:hypothetical protein
MDARDQGGMVMAANSAKVDARQFRERLPGA